MSPLTQGLNYRSACDPMDWILNRIVEQSPLGVSVGKEQLDYMQTMSLYLRKCCNIGSRTTTRPTTG